MAAACGSLQHMFENPLPENPTLLESLSSSFKQIISMNPLQDSSSFTEIFGELHFKEHHSSSPLQSLSSASSSSLFSVYTHTQNPQSEIERFDKEKNLNHSDSTRYYQQYKHGGHDFSSKNSDSLSLCTEGLGFESSDDIEDSNDVDHDWLVSKERPSFSRHSHPGELKRSRLSKGPFPPPISSIGSSGKPWVCFRSYREDGRFILKEIRIPTQEFLRACREDGRLKLQLIQSDDEIPEDEEEEEEEEEEEDHNDTEDIQEVKDDDFQAEGNDREEENEPDENKRNQQ